MDNIKIRTNMKVGQLDAENDQNFLLNCYFDNGVINILKDTSESEAIILGRTGAGKTASLMTIYTEIDKGYSKLINLEDVFLRYMDNSSIIKFLTDNGVNLDLFYRYLWRHILTVEFLKLKYPNLQDRSKFSQFIHELKSLIRSPEEKKALQYLEQWSDKYWIETVENIQEVVKNFSNDITAGLESSLNGNSFSLEGKSGLTEEQKIDVKHRAQIIVNNLQISELSKVIDLMDTHIFNDYKKPYYLLIDRLDENWVSMDVKYGLIKGLIEELKPFRKISNVKILVALRVDLYQLTIEKTRSSGFQEDKLLSLIYKLNWSEADLKQIIDKRINYLFKHQYTNREIGFEDLFPVDKKTENRNAWRYLLTRTFYRPRDILQFVNYCLSQSIDKTVIDWSSIYKAEKEYSNDRLKSLHEEWFDIYPSLKYTMYLLSNIDELIPKSDFASNVINDDEILKLYNLFLRYEVDDEISKVVFDLIDKTGTTEVEDVVNEILSCFYRTGLIGLSDNLPDSFEWSFKNLAFKSNFDCSHTKWIKVHKMFHEALHINSSNRI